MDTNQIVAELIQERDRLNRAIEALSGSVKRRGPPPAKAVRSVAAPPAASTPTEAAKPQSGRRAWSAEQLKAHSARMKAYWAKKRKAAAKG
jgi:hypothetical protein